MRFEHENRYAADRDAVVAMLTDQEYRSRLRSRTRAAAHDVRVDGEGAHVVVEVEQELRTHGIPSFAAKVVGDTVRLVQREEWTGHQATFELSIPGKPGHLRGTIEVVPDGDGSVERVAGEAKAHVPLVGGKIEKMLVGMITQSLEREESIGARWLAGER